MASVLNRTTLEYRRSVNNPDYPPSEWVINPDMSAVNNVDKRYWVIDGDTVREMTTAEKDAAMPTWQAQHLEGLKAAVNQYGESRYSEVDEMRLKHAYNRAKSEGMTNRAAYCKQVLDWEDALFAEYAARQSQIQGAATHDEVFAVSLDFSSFDATDPLATVVGAKSIAD